MNPSSALHGAGAALLAAALALSGCQAEAPESVTSAGAEPQQQAAAKPRVIVLSEAHRQLVARVAGPALTVEQPGTDAGQDPDQPPPAPTLLAMQSADRILVSSREQQRWLEHVSLPEEAVVELAAGQDHLLPTSPAHRHGPDGIAHRHGTPSLLWLDLRAAAEQVEAIRAALISLSPTQAEGFRQRAGTLLQELKQLDQRFAQAAAGLRGHTVLIVGNDLAAFAARYGLAARSLGERPEDHAELFLQELDRQRQGGPALLLLTAPLPAGLQPSLQQRGVQPVLLHSGVSRGSGGHFLQQLQRNLAALQAAA